jgi:hypothetical protein
MSSSATEQHLPFLTAEQQDFAQYVARRVGQENETRLGPKLDAIVQLLAALIERLDERDEQPAS